MINHTSLFRIQLNKGIKFFTQTTFQKTPKSVKNKYKTKYEKKVLVWIAISPKGMTKSFFGESGVNISSKSGVIR